MGQNIKQSKHYLGGDSSKEASISLPLRAISSGIIGGKGASRNSASSRLSAFFSALPYAVAVFGVAFLASCLTASIITPVQNSDAAQQVSATLDNSGYYVNVSASNLVSLDLVTTPDGATVVGKDTITTETNSPTGFKLYVSSNSTTSTSTRMTHTDGTNYIPAVSGTISSPTKLGVNTWGYALTSMSQNGATESSSGTVSASSYFIGMPLLNSENLIQNYTSSAPTGSGATVDIYFGVKANTALPAGTYTSTVVYTVLAEGSPAYNGEVSVSPDYSLMNGGGTLTIATGVYTNANDLGSISVTVGGQACTNVTKVANNSSDSINLTCTLPDLSSQSVGWKAVRVTMSKFGKTYNLTEGVKYYKPWSELVYMQDMTDIACNQATEATSSNYASAQKVLTDSRDGYTYTVRKLKDGNCWMTENLRLTFQDGKAVHSTTGALTTLTSDNSDFTTLSSWNGGGHTSLTSDAYWTDGANESNIAKSRSYGSMKSAYDDTNQYVGSFYNWFTATAGTGKYSTPLYTITENSICPKGWRMPLGGLVSLDKSYALLFQEVNASTLLTPPYSFVRAGGVSNQTGANEYYGLVALLWTATSRDSNIDHAFRANISHVNAYSADAYAKGWGFSVRCVSR